MRNRLTAPGAEALEARVLCSQLSKDVDLVALRDVHGWDRLAEFVDPAGAEFLIALATWDANPSDATELRSRRGIGVATYRRSLDRTTGSTR